MRRALLGCALIAIGTMPAVPGAAEQLVVNGRTRTYAIERPAAPGPRPTIIMLRGTGADVARDTKLATLAPQQGFAAVFPDAARPQWNFFLPGKELEFYIKAAKGSGGIADDGAFLKNLIADLVKRGVADPQRIYIAGESSGSLMALRMLCTDANLFAGAALISPAMLDRIGPDCHPSRPVPALLIKGTRDEVFPYAGGLIKPEETFYVWGNDRLVDFFKRLNNQSGAPQSSVLPRKVPNTVAVDRWLACSGSTVTVYRVLDGAHVAPADLNVAQVALDFFSTPGGGNGCVASLPGTGPGGSPAANPAAGGAGPGAGPNGPGGTPGTGPGNTPNTASTDPGAPNGTPGSGPGPVASDPTAPNAPGGDTGGLGPPTDPDNPGTNTAALGPPPDEPSSTPTGGLGPPPDPAPHNPPVNPPGPGTITTFVPPIFIPVQPPPPPQSMPPGKPGQVCDPKAPKTATPPPTPAGPCSTPPTLKLKPSTQTASVPPPQSGPLHLKPATPVPVIPASVTPTGPAKPMADDKPKKKKEAEKKHKPKYDNRAAANAAATAATAAAIISIVGAVSRRGGGGRGGGGGGGRGNPCHH